MCGTHHRPVRRLVDHEHALRTGARDLLSSAGSLAACCGRLAGRRGKDLVSAWADMTADGDRPAEDWPLAGILAILEDGVTDGDLAAARLVASMRRLRRGVRRLDTLAWLARDPREREAAEAA